MTFGAMRWRQSFYVHWLVPPDTLAPLLPRGVTLDLWHGHGVASLVAIDVDGPAPRRILETPLAHLFHYRQLNLRTYVEGLEGPGMTLLHTRIDRVTYALGARLAGMPYHVDRQLAYEVRDGTVTLRGRDFSVHGLVAATAPATLTPGSLEAFADERYLAYAQLPVGRTLCVRVSHAPWRARPVVLDAPLSPAPFGLEIDAAPAAAQLCEDVEAVVEHVALPAEEGEPLLAPA